MHLPSQSFCPKEAKVHQSISLIQKILWNSLKSLIDFEVEPLQRPEFLPRVALTWTKLPKAGWGPLSKVGPKNK